MIPATSASPATSRWVALDRTVVPLSTGDQASKRKKAPGGSPQVLEKAGFGQGNARKSKLFSWMFFGLAWLDFAGFGRIWIWLWIETAQSDYPMGLWYCPRLPRRLGHVDNPELRPLPAAVAVDRERAGEVHRRAPEAHDRLAERLAGGAERNSL